MLGVGGFLLKRCTGVEAFSFLQSQRNRTLLGRSGRGIPAATVSLFSTGGITGQMNLESAKKLAAFRAVDDHILNNQVVGIGSGSTVVYAVERIAQRVKAEGLKLICIPTSFQAKNLIIDNGLVYSDLDVHPQIDVTIDGCDECDDKLNLIKGGGGCQLQEKIVASASKKLIIIADHTKKSTYLGETWKKGVPLEVSMIGWKVVLKKLEELGKELNVRTEPQIRHAAKKMGPVVTDGGNFIVDFHIGNVFESQNVHSPKSLDAALRDIPGVLETGLFIGMAEQVYFGHDDGTVSTRLK